MFNLHWSKGTKSYISFHGAKQMYNSIQFTVIQFNFNAPVHVPLGGTFISLECKSTRKLMFVLGEANGTNVYGYLRLKHSIL